MIDLRQAIFAVIIAVLLSVFVFSSIDAVYPDARYDCDYPFAPDRNISAEQEQAWQACNDAYNQQRETREFFVFSVASILGIIAVIVGMYLPDNKDFAVAMGNGLLLGGLFIIFFGTMRGWSSIAVELRPLIILVELVIVSVVAWKKMPTKTKK